MYRRIEEPLEKFIVKGNVEMETKWDYRLRDWQTKQS